MRLHVQDHSLTDALVAFLVARPDCVAEAIAPGIVEVNLLGSERLPFMRLELDLRIAAWRAAHPGVEVALADS